MNERKRTKHTWKFVPDGMKDLSQDPDIKRPEKLIMPGDLKTKTIRMRETKERTPKNSSSIKYLACNDCEESDTCSHPASACQDATDSLKEMNFSTWRGQLPNQVSFIEGMRYEVHHSEPTELFSILEDSCSMLWEVDDKRNAEPTEVSPDEVLALPEGKTGEQIEAQLENCKLSLRQRQVLMLRLAGHSYGDIKDMLNISRGAAQAIYNQALKKLPPFDD